MSNYVELRKFHQCLNNPKDLSNGNISCNAFVTYYWKEKRIKSTITAVTLHIVGYEQGKISFESTDDIDVENFHTEFSPEWQTYSFDEENQMLVIEGKSTKMGGDYKVTIAES